MKADSLIPSVRGLNVLLTFQVWDPSGLVTNIAVGCVQGVKRQESEAYHPPPSVAEVKKTWLYTSTPPQHLRNA
jgi:hypothetical protein